MEYPYVPLYVCSRTSSNHKAVWRALRDEAGWNIVSTWIDDVPGVELWTRIRREISLCGGLILYVCADDLPIKGALVAVGMALAMSRPVVVVWEGRPGIKPYGAPLGSWLFAPGVYLCDTLAGARDVIQDTLEEGFKRAQERDLHPLQAGEVPPTVDEAAGLEDITAAIPSALEAAGLGGGFRTLTADDLRIMNAERVVMDANLTGSAFRAVAVGGLPMTELSAQEADALIKRRIVTRPGAKS